MHPAGSLSRFLQMAENRAAWAAIQDIAAAFRADAARQLNALVVLHGPSGAGKTHLAAGLVNELTRVAPALVCQHVSADDLKTLLPARQRPECDVASPDSADDADSSPDWLTEARHCDFLVLEDLHHLSGRAAEEIVQLLDVRQARRLPTLATSRHGPRQLALTSPRLPARLTSRLAAGLVVALDSLSPASRLQLLEEFAQRRQLAVAPEILHWLAVHLTGGGRQLEGAIAQLDTLTKLQRQPLKLADVRPHFRAQVDALRPSVERIVARVGDHFHVDPRELVMRRRLRAILVPRQICMYLARQLTSLSLKQIGASFGGHDHTTVLHACRKVEDALATDAILSGAVKQLHAELA
jgi:chromosomal replication initiator protein